MYDDENGINDYLGHELQEGRPEPSPHFVRGVEERLGGPRRAASGRVLSGRRLNLAVGAGLAAALLVPLAAFSAMGTTPWHSANGMTTTTHPTTTTHSAPMPTHPSPAGNQYGPNVSVVIDNSLTNSNSNSNTNTNSSSSTNTNSSSSTNTNNSSATGGSASANSSSASQSSAAANAKAIAQAKATYAQAVQRARNAYGQAMRRCHSAKRCTANARRTYLRALSTAAARLHKATHRH